MALSDSEKLKIAIQGLEDIVNPLGKIEREMGPRVRTLTNDEINEVQENVRKNVVTLIGGQLR